MLPSLFFNLTATNVTPPAPHKYPLMLHHPADEMEEEAIAALIEFTDGIVLVKTEAGMLVENAVL